MKVLRFIGLFAMISLACAFATSLPFVQKVTSSPTPNKFSYTISGTLNPARETTIPRNTRALVVWMVSEGDDHGYIFGEGKLDFERYRFSIHFDEPPPSEALNRVDDSSFGLGLVILTSNQKLGGRIDGDAFAPDGFIGISANHAVIFLDGNFESLEDSGWFKAFNQGYNVGRGLDLPEPEVFDIFQPVSPESMQIIIDDPRNIKFLNLW